LAHEDAMSDIAKGEMAKKKWEVPNWNATLKDLENKDSE